MTFTEIADNANVDILSLSQYHCKFWILQKNDKVVLSALFKSKNFYFGKTVWTRICVLICKMWNIPLPVWFVVKHVFYFIHVFDILLLLVWCQACCTLHMHRLKLWRAETCELM